MFSGYVGNRGSWDGLLVAVDERLEEVDAVMLFALLSVVALGLEDGVERLVGVVVGTGLADRFEFAVEEGGSVAPSVGQHALVWTRSSTLPLPTSPRRPNHPRITPISSPMRPVPVSA